MGLQAMVRWLLPREDVFYTLIERQGELLDEAARALAQLTAGAAPERVHAAVRDIEHRADAIVHEVEDRLAAVFVTPIDREDIQGLVTAIDDIVDDIDLTARTFVLYGVPRPSRPMTDMMQVLATMTEFLRGELPALRRHEYARLLAAARVIKQHEKAGDRLFRAALGQLFHDPAIGAKELLCEKEVLEDLELAIDRCETVAERLKHLAVKHG
ncbi:DUF47 domain-containing protein [Nannocystis radixulma]|uniref:DUF47 family protein n=1 Tax=Nannocystis radixulma TaxID=2995305 RepID=A0ABT5BF86_9BACT|nr:DUF47 family protein [Nannocystis radixulma]MDC0672378.1 DUF47 family protein [Nannocystis radixulma]